MFKKFIKSLLDKFDFTHFPSTNKSQRTPQAILKPGIFFSGLFKGIVFIKYSFPFTQSIILFVFTFFSQ